MAGATGAGARLAACRSAVSAEFKLPHRSGDNSDTEGSTAGDRSQLPGTGQYRLGQRLLKPQPPQRCAMAAQPESARVAWPSARAAGGLLWLACAAGGFLARGASWLPAWAL
jgi:hypothetical protein